MTDAEFLGYVDLHCRTERALFAREHVDRLYQLAGLPPIRWECRQHGWFAPPSFVAVRPSVANPLIEAARKRLNP